jgi:beta-galactosidase/beta-glucuronidase
MKNKIMTKYFSLFFACICMQVHAQQTQVQYLSGTGADNTVSWDFYCSDGINSKKWTTIEVPSCWEQQGFGEYNYGAVSFKKRLKETGTYKHNFNVPESWKSKEVKIVFEGVMTDASI